MQLYLAGPLGFSEAGRAFVAERLVPALAAAGHAVADPFAAVPAGRAAEIEAMAPGAPRIAAWRALNAEIGHANMAAIRAADAVVAVLDGVDVDSGTASEIGCAFALGKPVVGYRGDFRPAAENEGCTVNLQVEFFILESGGSIVRRLADLAPALARLR